MFYIAGAIYIFGCIIYWIFCEGTVQPWAIDNSIEEEKDQTKQEASKYAYQNEALEP